MSHGNERKKKSVESYKKICGALVEVPTILILVKQGMIKCKSCREWQILEYLQQNIRNGVCSRYSDCPRVEGAGG